MHIVKFRSVLSVQMGRAVKRAIAFRSYKTHKVHILPLGPGSGAFEIAQRGGH